MFDSLKNMAALGGIMKDLPRIKEKLRDVRERLARSTVEAESGSGAVRAVVTGDLTLRSVRINPALLSGLVHTASPAHRPPDCAAAEDLITAAVNAAMEKARELIKQEMTRAAQELNLPIPAEALTNGLFGGGGSGGRRAPRLKGGASSSNNRAYPEPVQRMIEEFSRLPGIGARSAERMAFHILKSPKDEALRLSRAIADVKQKVRSCSICFNLADIDPCRVCADDSRDGATVLIVEQPRDLIMLEQTGMFKGVYHVLLGRLDPLSGIEPANLTISHLLDRLDHPDRNARGVKITEVILGLNPDMEGDTTALYLAQQLAARPVEVTRLARGLPAGSQLEYASRAVLADAIEGRRKMQ